MLQLQAHKRRASTPNESLSACLDHIRCCGPDVGSTINFVNTCCIGIDHEALRHDATGDQGSRQVRLRGSRSCHANLRDRGARLSQSSWRQESSSTPYSQTHCAPCWRRCLRRVAVKRSNADRGSPTRNREALGLDALDDEAPVESGVVKCSWCSRAFYKGVESELQARSCAASVWSVQDRHMSLRYRDSLKPGDVVIQGHYGSHHDARIFRFVRNWPKADVDPVCDRCVDERILVGDVEWIEGHFS